MKPLYNPVMFRSNFEDLRRHKAAREQRDIPLQTVAAESGLSIATVHRVKKGVLTGMSLSTIDALCRYFKVTSVAELIEYVPEEN
jgi:DNA-binding Xre family transcriptional regulator